MSLTQNQTFLLKKVFTKVEYDRINERYIIRIKHYIHLKLTQTQMNLLEKMCKENEIELEKLPKQITKRETTKLLEEYNKLKLEHSNQKELDKIRNKIVEGNLEFLYKLISESIESINNEEDREDLYSEAYLLLHEAVDDYNVKEHKSFIEYIYHLVYDKILKKIKYKQNPRQMYLAASRIKEAYESYIERNGKRPPQVILSTITGYSKEQLEYFEQLENATSILSTDEMEDDTVDYDTIDFEELADTILKSKNFNKVLLTLPQKEQMVLTVCFGLDGKGIRTDRQAGRELGISNEAIGNIKRRALIFLALPPRRNYLQDIYLGTSRISLCDKWEIISRYPKNIVTKNRDYIEDFLIRQMPHQELTELINQIPKEYRNILALTYGLVDGIEHTKKEISKILNLSSSNVYIKTNEGRYYLRKLLEKTYNRKYIGNIDKDYLDYMMDEYMQRGYKKIK